MVYLALDIPLDRQVAIKVLHAQYSGDASFVERFLREGRAMARLDHQNIIRVYAVEEDKGSHFIVMEFFPGKDLKQFVRDQGQIPIDDIIKIGIKVAEGLENAHDQRIVHRDIKPANIMVDDQGRVKITDFGIAAALEEASLTATGTVIGTPLYMSPEQAKFGSVDARSDLYSLGMVLYELATSQTPFQGMPAQTILGKLAYEPGELTLTFPEGIPVSFQNVLRTLLKKNPDDRFQNAHELALRLKACSAESSLSSIGEGETMVIPDEPTFLLENDSGQSDAILPIGTTQAASTAPKAPSKLTPEYVSEERAPQASSTVPRSSSLMSSLSQGGAEAKSALWKKISPSLIGLGIGMCLVIGGGLVFFISSESTEDAQEAQTSNSVEIEMVKAKNELSDLKREYDDEHQLNVKQAKELNEKTQGVLNQMVRISGQSEKETAQQIAAIHSELMGIKNQVTFLNTRLKNTKGYLTKKGTFLIERINTLKKESPETFKNLKVETQVRQFSNSRDVYENFHKEGVQNSINLVAKAETELQRKKSSLDKQKNVAERERQELVGKAQRALLAAQQELKAEQGMFQDVVKKIEEKILVAKVQGESLKPMVGDAGVTNKVQNLRQEIQGLKTDFEQELIRHQTEGQPKLDKAEDALAMAEMARSKARAEAKSANIEEARGQLLTVKQDFLVAQEQKRMDVENLLRQAASVFRDVDKLIAEKGNDQSAQRRILAEAVYQDLYHAKRELEGEQKRNQLIFKGLNQRINNAQEGIQVIEGLSSLDGAMDHVEILRQDLRGIGEHMGQELERVETARSPLLAKVKDVIVKAASAKTEAPSELRNLRVGELQEQLANAKREFLKDQAQDIQEIKNSFRAAQISLDESANLLAKKIEANEQKQVLVGNLIGQLKKAQKQYQDQHEDLRRSRQEISEALRGKLAKAKNIGDSTTQFRQIEDIQNLRQEVQNISKEIKDLNARYRQVKEELQKNKKTLVANVDKQIQEESDGQMKLKFALALQEMKTQRQQFESGGQLLMKMQNAELAEVENLLNKTEQALAQAKEEKEKDRRAKEEWAGQTKKEMLALRQDIDQKRIVYQDAVKKWNGKFTALSNTSVTFQKDLEGFKQEISGEQQQNTVAEQLLEEKVRKLLGKSHEVKTKAPSEYNRLQLDTFSKHLSEAQSEFNKTFDWHNSEMRNLFARVDAALQGGKVVTTGPNESGLDHILKSFQVAYEQKDLMTLRQITSMKATREQYLRTLFARHSKLQITTEIRDISQTEAKAIILITKLIDLNGKVVRPNPIIRKTTVTIPKEGNKWGKIQW